MNDLVEGCKITGDIRLDNEDIYGGDGCQPAAETCRYGIPEAKSISDEHL